jgi:AcrR family transcriptional regulator
MARVLNGGPTTTRLSGAERRERLIRHAREIIRRDGLDGFTMEAVAAEGGVSRALTYRHLKSIDEVIHELYAFESLRFYEAVAAAIEDAGDFDDEVRAGIRANFEYVGTEGDLIRLLRPALSMRRYREERRVRISAWGRYRSLRLEAAYDGPASVAATITRANIATETICINSWYLGGADREEATQLCIDMSFAAINSGHLTRRDPSTSPRVRLLGFAEVLASYAPDERERSHGRSTLAEPTNDDETWSTTE